MGDQTTAFVKQYEDALRLLAQQKGTKLRKSVQVDTNFVGEFKFYDQLGATEMNEKTSRNQDTPDDRADHKRRRVTKRDFNHNTFLDKSDQLVMIIDPKGKYVINAGMAAGRKQDDLIVEAFNATAFTGKEGSTSTSFDSNNQIAHGSTGLTKAKLLSAKLLLDNADIEDEDRWLAVAPQQVIDLLDTVEVASSDYNTVKALVDGQLNTWLGFNWIKLTRLGVTSQIRRCYAYHNWAMQLAIQKEPSSRTDERRDKSYSWKVYTEMAMGATRLEEARIVEISCDES